MGPGMSMGFSMCHAHRHEKIEWILVLIVDSNDRWYYRVRPKKLTQLRRWLKTVGKAVEGTTNVKFELVERDSFSMAEDLFVSKIAFWSKGFSTLVAEHPELNTLVAMAATSAECDGVTMRRI